MLCTWPANLPQVSPEHHVQSGARSSDTALSQPLCLWRSRLKSEALLSGDGEYVTATDLHAVKRSEFDQAEGSNLTCGELTKARCLYPGTGKILNTMTAFFCQVQTGRCREGKKAHFTSELNTKGQAESCGKFCGGAQSRCESAW